MNEGDKVVDMSGKGVPHSSAAAGGNGGGNGYQRELTKRIADLEKEVAVIQNQLGHVPTKEDLTKAVRQVQDETDKKWKQYVTWALIVLGVVVTAFLQIWPHHA